MKKADKLRLRLELIEERGWVCEFTGKPLSGFHLHHGIIGDCKALRDVLHCKENLFIVDPNINISRVLDNQEQRDKFWGVQVERYGEDRMRGFIDSVNEQVKIPYKF